MEGTDLAAIHLRINRLRERYRAHAEAEHGSIINPITGEEVDIMQQCVNLQLETGHNHHEVGDTDAYREVIADFAKELWQGMPAWTVLDEEVQQGMIHRVNREDEHGQVTYDFQYTKIVKEAGKSVSKVFIVKDRRRDQLQTRQLLVKGDPAGGKTTFAKQLLTWIMRSDDKWLVPVMVRTIDLVRSHDQLDHDNLVMQYLAMMYKECHWELIDLARQHGRLLLILDGFDEAGFLERDLAKEISSKLNNQVFLPVTSREMSGLHNGKDFDRFRSVRVKELNEAQRRQVIQRRLKDGEVEAFCNQLTLNPALCAMTRNPLLLNVTLSVYETTAERELGASLNRGKVYGLALDGMLSNLERAKAVHASGYPGGPGCLVSGLREVLKSIAFLAHSQRSGRGVRDFRRELVHKAIRQVNLKGVIFELTQWNEVEDLIKKGRLPLLTWFSEDGEDTFRFAHLTFQEFLCAEYCLQQCQESEDFVLELRDLICSHEPREIVERGWWQQSIQMFCDLAVANQATAASGQCWSSVLGECLLQLGRFHPGADAMSPSRSSTASSPRSAASSSDEPMAPVTAGRALRHGSRRHASDPKTVNFLHLVNDTNILTVLSMIRSSDSVEHLKLGGGLTSSGISTIRTLHVKGLRGLYLNQNYIGPEGCKAIAAFMRKPEVSLEILELVNNVICQGVAKEEMLPVSRRNPPSGYYDSYHQDLSGLVDLLQVVREHPSLRILDLRGNFLPFVAGEALMRVAAKHPQLEQICGVDLHSVRRQDMVQFELQNDAYFFNADYQARPDAPFLSTGGAAFLVRLLLRYPQRELQVFKLANQALASDLQNVVQLYDELGQVLAGGKLKHLDLSGFWDSGADAGVALGKHLAKIPSLKSLRVGTNELSLEQIRKGSSDTILNLGRSRMRDCGAGILSQCLPANVTKIDLSGAGLGAHGYKILSQIPTLQQINGVDMSAFKATTEELDFSETPVVPSGSVAAIIARTVLTPKLQRLNLSKCNLTSKSHVHPLTPVVGGSSGIGCNGGCDCRTFEGTNAYKHCADCDLDFCSTCCMSQCPMIDLAESLERLPHLVSLKLSECSFQGGRMGPVRSHLDIDGYQVLGEALARHPNITELDLSKNFFQGQGFAYLLRGVVEMQVLHSITLGAEALRFQDFLTLETLEVGEEWLPVESQLLCMAIRRNSRLRQLHLSKAQADLRIDSVKALVESLEALHVQGTMLDVVTIGGLTFPLRQMAAGLMDSLDFASSTRHNRCALAPLLVFALDHSSGLRNLNFINNDFGAENEHVVDSVLRLAQRGLEVYNDLPLHGAAEGFDVQLRAVMPHGLCVFASTFLPRQRYLKHLNLQSCGLDARSLGAILLAVLQIQTVITLDISSQPLKKAGMEHLASFLRSDKKLQMLTAQNISTPSYYTAEMLDFAKAMEVNSTLATLDLRGNALHGGIVGRLRRTMEEKRSVLPLPFDSKICFLMCNRRMPYHLQLPEVAQVCEVSRMFIGGSYSPLFMIFQFCGQPRLLQLDDEQMDPGPSETDMLWRPWMRNLATDLEGFVQAQRFRHIGVFDSDEEDDDFPWDDLRAPARLDSSGDEVI